MNKLKIFVGSVIVLSAAPFFPSCSDAPNEKDYYIKPAIENFTYSNTILAYDSFVQELFVEDRGIYRVAAGDASGNIAVGWCQSMMFDMSINAYKLTNDQKYLDLMYKHYQGCKDDFTFDWYDYKRWDLYDDMMWWVGALARAYLLTNDQEFLEVSEKGFKRVWYGKSVEDGGDPLDAKGSYDQINGGMYWDWKFGRTGKMACINFPTIIAAMDLYKATGNVDYLNKAKLVYDWAIPNLYNPENGAIADSKHDGNANAAWTMLIYNQATAMGAAAMLYLETKEDKYLTVAVKTMEYIVNEKSTSNDILIPEGDPTQSAITDEKGIYSSVLAQYYPFLVECGQTQFNDYIERSINWGWHNRDKQRNLTNKFLEQVPSAGQLSSYTASGIPALMLTFPNVKDRK